MPTAESERGLAEAPKLKDYFTADVVRSIGERVSSGVTGFDVERFVTRTLEPPAEDSFFDLEFTARSRRIADAIEDVAPISGVDLVAALIASLPEELDGFEGVLNDGFDLWPYGEVIARHGAEHPDECLVACYELTKRFTAEFAIRPILEHHPGKLADVKRWTSDPNEHVRRLASEGTRPRLPWAQRLNLPLEEVLALLGELRTDPSKYVQKSVGNHLNDLAKDHPDRIISLLKAWHDDGDDVTQWIVRHGLRNHLKDGHPDALAIFGYGRPDVAVGDLQAAPATVSLGESVTAFFTLQSLNADDQLLMIDLVMGYVKANGSVSPKVFKFKELTMAPNAVEACTKSFEMIERSTRKLYPGTHSLTVRVNGKDLATTEFELVP